MHLTCKSTGFAVVKKIAYPILGAGVSIIWGVLSIKTIDVWLWKYDRNECCKGSVQAFIMHERKLDSRINMTIYYYLHERTNFFVF
jgi:hypothetical protein